MGNCALKQSSNTKQIAFCWNLGLDGEISVLFMCCHLFCNLIAFWNLQRPDRPIWAWHRNQKSLGSGLAYWAEFIQCDLHLNFFIHELWERRTFFTLKMRVLFWFWTLHRSSSRFVEKNRCPQACVNRDMQTVGKHAHTHYDLHDIRIMLRRRICHASHIQ